MVTAASLVAVCLLAGAIASARGCSTRAEAPVELPLRKGGLTLSRSAQPERSGISALPGDWVLESDAVRVIVGADGPGVERQLRYGAIMEVSTLSGVPDKVLELRTQVEISGKPSPLRVERVEPIVRGPRPALRIVQSSREGALRAETLLLLTPGKPWVELRTSVTNVGTEPIRALRVGDRARWPGAQIFAPRLGFVKNSDRASVPWLARLGRDMTHALVFPSGSAESSFAFDRIGPTEQRSLLYSVDLEPGAAHEYRRYLVVVAGGIERAAETAWRLAGKAVGRVIGNLLPAPTWATVQARHPDGKTVLAVRATAAGRFELPLPRGEYQLALDAPGGVDLQRQVVVESDETVEATLMPPESGRLRYSVTDTEGNLLPARYIVRGVAPTPDPNFGPAERAEGAGNVFYTRTGEGYVELPPGRYRVTVTRGIEYSVHEEEIILDAEKGHTVRSVLERVVDTTGFIGCDFHVHAAPSPDSNVTLDDRVVSLMAEGIEFAAATDHNHVTDYGEVLEGFGAFSWLGATSGVEITTRSWGHFIAFPYPSQAPAPPHAGLEPPELFAAARRMAPKAVIQVNHPRMPGIGYFNRGEVDALRGVAASEGFSFDFDTLEVVNGFELTQPNVIWGNVNEWMQLLNAGRRFTAVGNSDTHRLFYQWAGYPRTYVRVQHDQPDATSAQEIAESLRAGHAIVSNGVFVNARVNGSAGPGDTTTTQGGAVALEVVVRAAEWVDVKRADLYVNGEVTQTARARSNGAGLRLSWHTSVPLVKDSWLVVVVRGERTIERILPKVFVAPFGFTNPIFVDVDGDNVFTPPAVPGPAVTPGAHGNRGRSSR